MTSGASAAIGAESRVLGVIGDPVRHSLSPLLHNAAYRALGLDISYFAFAVPAGQAGPAISGARALGLLGLSVTTPHKADAARHADQRSALVERLGAANTIVFRAGVALAESTDGIGLVRDVQIACGFSPAGRVCAVLGAGGAGRAVIAALAEAGASSVIVVNREPSRALAAVELAPGVARVGTLQEAVAAELVVNATSIGLSASRVGSGEDPGLALARHLHSGQLVLDLVYRPAETSFLAAAARAGARTRNGLGMLVHQAARQVELFTGHEAPVEAMWQALAGEAR